MLMSYDEARHSIAVQGNVFVDGEVCMALRRALGVVPDARRWRHDGTHDGHTV